MNTTESSSPSMELYQTKIYAHDSYKPVAVVVVALAMLGAQSR